MIKFLGHLGCGFEAILQEANTQVDRRSPFRKVNTYQGLTKNFEASDVRVAGGETPRSRLKLSPMSRDLQSRYTECRISG